MRRLLPSLAILALVAFAGPVAGERGEILAGSADYAGISTQSGELAMLFLLGADFQGEQVATPWMAFEATQLRAVSYTQTYTEARLPDTPLPANAFTVPGDPAQVDESHFEAVKARLVASQPHFQVNLFSQEGTLTYKAMADDGKMTSQGPVRMSEGAFGADVNQPADPADVDSPSFAFVERTGPLVVHGTTSPHTELGVQGTLVLEMRGVTLELDGPQGRVTLASGTWREPVEGAPAATGEVVYEVRSTFIRLFLEDADLSLAVDGGTPRIEWASASLDLQAGGPVTFSRSYGSVHKGDKEFVSLEDDRFVLPAGNLLAIAPQADGLAVDISEPAVGARGTIGDVPAPASAALMGVGAVLALAAAVGVGVLRRFLRRPQLAEVEAAIEQGQFRKAARLAGRILARDPADESAILARGIALTKAGDNEAAVRELAHHLSHSTASDGSLHYVLGLAQLDLGRKDEGRAALREAVRLTPALQAEVGMRLGKAFSFPSPIPRETHGYA